MTRTRGRRPLACHHEAGHAVARWWLGFHSDDVAVLTLDEVRAGEMLADRRGREYRCEGLLNGYDISIPLARETLSGRVEPDRTWFARQVERRTEMALVELYAGFWAEARYRRRSSLICVLGGGSQDLAQAREVAAAWFDTEEACSAAHSRTERIARALARSPKAWAAVQAIAAALFDCGRIDGDEVDALSSAAYGGSLDYDRWAEAWPPTPAQIRAGFLPVREARQAA